MKLQSPQIHELIESLQIDSRTTGRLERFCHLVLDANLRINLISRGGDQTAEVERQLFLSLSALPFIPVGTSLTWLDIGSGGGFPALPIALCRERVELTLAESIAKKAFFLERTIEALEIPNVTVANIRVGQNGEGLEANQGRFDWVSVKAVTDWGQTLNWGRSLLSRGGKLLTYKPDRPTDEEIRTFRRFDFELIGEMEIMDSRESPSVRIIVLESQLTDN
ncbi:MAG: RsmG family class I SAM-dependent methyltransferase [Candidatus Zixiibacteriota bacterium]